MKKFARLLLLLVATTLCLGASAQALDERLKASAALSPDLTFPSEPKQISLFTSSTTLSKPVGDGPFPALVLMHTCGGIRTEMWDWAKRSVEQGYVVLVVDSLGPRNLKSNCMPPNVVPAARGTKDAFQALAHLKFLPFVDAQRIGLVGFSWGAVVALLTSSPEMSSALSTGPRFAAAVSFYPLCHFAGNPRNPGSFTYLRTDTDKPLLVLMGAEDNETPPADCLPRLDALRATGAPVEWHLYPATTHCWDCSTLHNLRKTDFQGNQVTYRFDKEITADSARRAFEFLARKMPKP